MKCESSSSLLCKIVLGFQGHFKLHINFSMNFSVHEKNVMGIFIGVALNL